MVDAVLSNPRVARRFALEATGEGESPLRLLLAGCRRRLPAVPLVLGLAVFAGFPFGYLLFAAFSRSTLGRPFQRWVGWSNVEAVLSSSSEWAALLNTIALAVPVSIVETALGLALALLLNEEGRRSTLIRPLILLPLITPPVMVGVAWKLSLAPSGGWVNTYLAEAGLIDRSISFLGETFWAPISVATADVWQWTPFAAIMILAALRSRPPEVIEAARIDGAGPRDLFLHITLPQIAPTLTAVFLIRLIIALRIFDLVFTLTFGGPGNATTTAGFAVWRTALESFDIGRASVETLVFAILVGLTTWPVLRLHKRVEEVWG